MVALTQIQHSDRPVKASNVLTACSTFEMVEKSLLTTYSTSAFNPGLLSFFSTKVEKISLV
jgi:hypothetical protein